MANQKFEVRVQEYLDAAITHWRERRKRSQSTEQMHECSIYIDAFQSARQSLLGEMLPETN